MFSFPRPSNERPNKRHRLSASYRRDAKQTTTVASHSTAASSPSYDLSLSPYQTTDFSSVPYHYLSASIKQLKTFAPRPSDFGAVVSSTDDSDPLKHIKGLRHFSKLVADKVESKGETTYSEVRFWTFGHQWQGNHVMNKNVVCNCVILLMC
jgi:hypothetical protein